MACERNQKLVAKAASLSGGIPKLVTPLGTEAGQKGEVVHHLPSNNRWKKESDLPYPQPLPWPPARKRRSFWGDHRQHIKIALQAWRSKADDRTLTRMRSELATDLAERAACNRKNGHPAGIAGELAEERAALLLFPPKSISVAERVERVAILDNAIALLRLKQIINEQEYRAAVIDTVYTRKNSLNPSKTLVSWLVHRPAGIEIESASPVDPTRKIRTRYRIVDLSEPILSHTLTGEVNPAYDPSLQPRQRERIASRLQIDHIARNLDSHSLLKMEANWAEGPPIIGEAGMVESGNGRLLSLQRAADINPAGYAVYCNQLMEQAPRLGLNPAEITAIGQPVLVRERLTFLTAQERLRFVNEANASGAARMGLYEQARADASMIPAGFFTSLHLGDNDHNLFETLSKKINAPIIARFLNLLPDTERAALVNQRGILNIEGANRLERAMFAYTMPSEAGKRLAQLIFEEGEAIDRLGAGLRQSLLKQAQLEDMVRSGQRSQNFSLVNDLAVAVEKMRDIRQQGLSINDYLRQYKMFPELSPLQEQLLIQLGERRHSAKAVARLLNTYADEAMLNTPPPNQLSISGHEFRLDREDLFRAALRRVEGTWVELKRWSAAQQVLSGLDVPASRIQNLTPAQQVKGIKLGMNA